MWLFNYIISVSESLFFPYHFSKRDHTSLEVGVDLTFVESMRAEDILRILDTKAKKVFFDGFEVVLIKNFIVDIKGNGQNGNSQKTAFKGVCLLSDYIYIMIVIE